MSFSKELLLDQLKELETQAGKPARYVIALSGGLDSMVLAHALANSFAQTKTNVPVVAIHIDHGLQAESDEWQAHCAAFAASLGIEFHGRKVNVDATTGKGPEAAARAARYAALAAELEDDDWLLSAHHREDQAETLLLNLARGSGPAGLAGIGSVQRFGPGWLVRPLLPFSQASLRDYAEEAQLAWIEDPSNAERRFSRNFLRHDVMPLLQSRWPDIAASLQRSAQHAGDAARLLSELAALDLAALGGDAKRLPVDGMQALSPARQKNLLRYALRHLNLATPSTLQLERVLCEVIPARADAKPHVTWPGASVRRYRNGIYLLPEELAAAPVAAAIAAKSVALGAGLGVLRFEADAGRGLSAALFERGLRLETRQGGEEIRPDGQGHTRKLKKLLQEEGVVPWMRDRVPLVYAGEELVAVGDLWIAADAAASPGLAVRWSERPALH